MYLYPPVELVRFLSKLCITADSVVATGGFSSYLRYPVSIIAGLTTLFYYVENLGYY